MAPERVLERSLGVSGGVLGGPWGVPGRPWGGPWGSLEDPWRVPRGLGRVPGGQDDSKMALRTRLEANLGPTWGNLVPTWGQHGPNLARLGSR